VLGLWSALWVGLRAHPVGQSWHFFAEGGLLLSSGGPRGGLHLYATHPALQMGPLALAVSAVLRVMGPGSGRVIAVVAMSATGLPLLAAVWRLLPVPERRRRGRLLVAGLVFLPVWTELTTHYGHLDDVLALGLSVAAAHAVSRRHPVWAGVALAAAVDAKPWAAAFVALLLALPRKDRWPALGVFAAGVAVAWLPFLLADSHTLMAARFTIPNDYSSALRVLGVNAAGTPWWDRPAQLALGVAAGCLAVRRGRWQAVILLAVAARIMLDPSVYAYYTAGALLGTVMFDLLLTRWRLPWTTLVAAALLYAARFTGELFPFTLHDLGLLRAVFGIGVPLIVLCLPDRWMARQPGRHARAPAITTFGRSAAPQVRQAEPQTVPAGAQGYARGIWDAARPHQRDAGQPHQRDARPHQRDAGPHHQWVAGPHQQPQHFPGPAPRVAPPPIAAQHGISDARRPGTRAGAGPGGPGRR